MFSIRYLTGLLLLLMLTTNSLAEELNTVDEPIDGIQVIEQAISTQADFLNQQQIQSLPILRSEKNEFTVGTVTKHRLNEGIAPEQSPIFIIGDDETSIEWAKANYDYLKQSHAQGIVTHIDSLEALKRLQEALQLPLMPANIKGLSALIGTTHYPVLIANGWVTQ